MDKLADLNNRLKVIGRLLDGAATQVRDAPPSPTGAHIQKIGEAMAAVFEIQCAIYKLRPELDTPYEDPPQEVQAANRRLGDALIAAYDLADASRVPEAVALLRDFAKLEPSEYHRGLAEAEAERIRANYET